MKAVRVEGKVVGYYRKVADARAGYKYVVYGTDKAQLYHPKLVTLQDVANEIAYQLTIPDRESLHARRVELYKKAFNRLTKKQRKVV